MKKIERSRLRVCHFEVRIPLIFITWGVICGCISAPSWAHAGWLIVVFLTFVLLTHRPHNMYAQWVHDNTDYACGGL